MAQATELDKLFTFHRPTNEQASRYDRLRRGAMDYATLICELTPPSAEQTLALRALHVTSMHANSAIAVNEPGFGEVT